MKTKWQTWLTVLLMLLGPTVVWAQRFDTGDVDVQVLNDRGRPFPQYPLRRDAGPVIYKAHLEAVRDQNYSIQIRNRTNRRIGVVIAVDGRNIISGNRSNLEPHERMYVLEPHQQETYEGWRTGSNRVNRFYFTDAGDSYAGAWGDYSAMGVIAVAAYREARPYPPPAEYRYEERRGDDRHMESQGAAPPPVGATPSAKAEPGTGYGESQWSPSRRVEFEAESRPFAQYFLKYAWRDTLCRQRVIDCDARPRPPHNRFWDEEDDRYAPPPPPRYEHRDDDEDWR